MRGDKLLHKGFVLIDEMPTIFGLQDPALRRRSSATSRSKSSRCVIRLSIAGICLANAFAASRIMFDAPVTSPFEDP
jgi:hypothetical protein